jgi:hypothetical protein
MTIGEDRVRVKFNPSGNGLVDRIKQKTAELIDECDLCASEDQDSSERKRLWALAMTHYEDAAMWAVKAATFGK